MHSHLQASLSEMSAEDDLPPTFREHWVNSQPFDFSVNMRLNIAVFDCTNSLYTFTFQFQNYTEQPGIQPHIRYARLA